MSLLQDKIEQHLKERDWGKSPPGDFAKSMSIEAGELLEHFQWSNPSTDELRNDPDKFKKVQYEMADVVIYAIELSVVLGIDFEKAVLEKLAIAQKKYPVKLVKGKFGSLNYQRIKERSRRLEKN